MTGGTLIYKCRLCGGLDKSTHVPNGNMILIYMPIPKDLGSLSPKMLGVHTCEDGQVGVTDLVGVELDD